MTPKQEKNALRRFLCSICKCCFVRSPTVYCSPCIYFDASFSRSSNLRSIQLVCFRSVYLSSSGIHIRRLPIRNWQHI